MVHVEIEPRDTFMVTRASVYATAGYSSVIDGFVPMWTSGEVSVPNASPQLARMADGLVFVTVFYTKTSSALWRF